MTEDDQIIAYARIERPVELPEFVALDNGSSVRLMDISAVIPKPCRCVRGKHGQHATIYLRGGHKIPLQGDEALVTMKLFQKVAESRQALGAGPRGLLTE